MTTTATIETDKDEAVRNLICTVKAKLGMLELGLSPADQNRAEKLVKSLVVQSDDRNAVKQLVEVLRRGDSEAKTIADQFDALLNQPEALKSEHTLDSIVKSPVLKKQEAKRQVSKKTIQAGAIDNVSVGKQRGVKDDVGVKIKTVTAIPQDLPFQSGELINIADILQDNGKHPRDSINKDTVAEYAEAMKAGTAFPPIIVYQDGENIYPGDGTHRIEACRKLGLTTIKAVIHQGTARDAILFAVGANTEHGLRRTNADKRKAVAILLRDQEWCKWSNSKIAQICSVSDDLVAIVRHELEGTPHLSFPKDSQRLVERNGKVFTQNTGKIGKSTGEECRSESKEQSGGTVIEANSAPSGSDPQKLHGANPGSTSVVQATSGLNGTPALPDKHADVDPWLKALPQLREIVSSLRQMYPRQAEMLEIAIEKMANAVESSKAA